MARIRSFLTILLLLLLPCQVQAGILNLRGGLGTVVQKDRDTRDSVRYSAVLLTTSYRTPQVEFALDLPFRWEIQTREFDDTIWDRKGDLLRPLKLLRYRSRSGQAIGGVEVIDDWTPGEGFLVRNLSGRGEIDYVLPGLRFRWSDEKLELDAGMDRPVDPTVQAVALKWNAAGSLTVILEGAADPKAPSAFGGNSSSGRPVADDSERLTAEAAGIRFGLLKGDLLDIAVGAHAGRINSNAKGLGGELSATLDFSSSYRNQLQILFRSVSCEGGYVPAWFDGAYPLLRWGPEGRTFLELNPLDSTVPDRTMESYGIEYNLGDAFSISAGFDRFDDNSIRRGRFEAQLREENSRGLELAIWSRADDPDAQLFSEDSNLHSRASALYNFLPHFLLNISYEHSWAFVEEEAGFAPVNSILVGVMYDISL